MSVDASAINEIFHMFHTDDPNPDAVLDELKKVKETLDQWEEADGYIDTPDDLTMLVSGLREDYDEAEERIEEIERVAEEWEDSFNELKEENEKLEEHVQKGCKLLNKALEDIIKLEKENEELKRSLQFVRNTLTEPIQEAVPPV